MVANPKTIKQDELVVNALATMKKNKITVLLVPDGKKRLKGIIHMHDILNAGIV
jgi:arabinose-5-phosphate isomerase